MLEEWNINGRQWSHEEVETMLGLIYTAWFVGRKGGDWETPLLVLVEYLAERDVNKYDLAWISERVKDGSNIHYCDATDITEVWPTYDLFYTSANAPTMKAADICRVHVCMRRHAWVEYCTPERLESWERRWAKDAKE